MALGSGNIKINVGAEGLTDDIVRQVRTAEKKIRPMSVSLNEKGFRQPLGRITGDLAEFQKSLDASVARTLAFGAAVGVLNAVTQGFKAMIASAVEVEKSLTDINVILNLNANALANFSSKLFDTAKNTGQSFQTVSEAAVELSRQGLGAEETLSRINDAMILTRLSGMEAAKSVETLTAAVNSFGDTAITTTEIVNKLATVDAAFAVSTEDLANGLARAGATAQSAKVDFNELLAAVTSVQQTTARGGAVIGNAFKSIFTRIQRAGVREALEEIGVATTDAAGNIRGALDILKDYSSVYGTLTDSQQAFTDELIAGVFQINNLKALVKDLGSDYSIYERALNQSNNATDEAVRRNEKLQSTLSTLINEATVNAKELAATLGDLIATPAIENLLNLFNSISGALSQALDPEKGSKLMQGMFKAIGDFIAGPGLILVGVAFVKLFKFITGQSLKALKEIFKIGSATNKIAETEAKIGFLLKNNKNLYEAISNSALNHEQKEELVLQTIKQQNAAYLQQQKLISRISSSRAISAAVNVTNNASGFVPARAKGYVPNFTNQIEGAINSERAAISAGEGGASRSAKPKVLKNFPMGGGRKQTIVANTDEVIVPNFGGSTGSAIFNKDMIKKSGGVPEGAIPVANGYIPNFVSSLENNKDYKKFLMSREGLQIDAERDLGGFGMVSAKGTRGRASSTLKRISGFSPAENESIINKISGSKLTKEDKKYISKIIAKKKTSFNNIATSSIIEMSSPEVSKKVEGKVGAINDLIQPNIANAVASVASRIYNGILGDEVGTGLVNQVRKQAGVDKSIVSTGVEGGIFESALRLGSLESAKSLGRDSSDAIWDFEEGSRITQDMRDIFFQGYGIAKGDAKRSGGAESLREVVEKSHKNFFKEPLEDIYARHWAPFFEAGNRMTEGERSKGKRSGIGLKRAGGFIPNYIFEGDKGLPAQAIAIQPLNKVGIKTNQTVRQLSEKSRLSNAKIGSDNQKADLVDSFNATIVPEYQRFTDGQFRKWSNKLSDNSIKSEGYARRLFGGNNNLLKKYGADRSAVQSLNTSYQTIQDYKKAQQEFKAQKKIKSFDSFVKRKSKYKNLIGKTGVAKIDNLKNNFENRIKGVIGEITAARKEKVKIQSGNSFFDLANGKEVKTVRGEQKASAILRKGANGWLKNKNIFNKKEDKISMGEISVIIPRDTVLASGGFIPNFAEGLIDSPFRKGATRQVKLSVSQVQSLIDAGNYDEAEGLVYSALTGSDTTKTVGEHASANLKLLNVLTKAKRDRYKDLSGRADSSNPAWAQWDVNKGSGSKDFKKRGKEMSKKTGRATLKAYKKYFTFDGGEVESLMQNANGLRSALKPIGKKYDSDISFKTPRTAMGAYTHNDSLVIHYQKKEAAKAIELAASSFFKKIGITAGPRSYTNGYDVWDPSDSKGVKSYGQVLARNIVGDLARGYSKDGDFRSLLQNTLTSRQNDSYANGYIPNFADALEAAIAREKEALSDQGSSAKVYVDQDNRLKGSKNPMGLLVANTRDEPLNGSQGVDRAISTGLNPKNKGKTASAGYIPNYNAAITNDYKFNLFEQPEKAMQAQSKAAKDLAKSTEESTKALKKQKTSSEGLLGKVFALEFALSALGSTMDISATGTQSTIAGITGLSAVFPDLIGKLGPAGKALGALAVAAGAAYDIYRNLYDPQLNNIKALEREIATREKSINIISQNIESLDKFATSAAKFGAAAGKGDIEASGKILQNIFEQAKDIRSLNTDAFDDLISSIGDTDKFNESIQNFKNLASQGKNLKTFSNDFAAVVKKFNEELDSQQFLGIFDIGVKGVDIRKFGDEIKSMSDILTAGLPDEKIKKISDSLKEFNPSANSASNALLGLQDIIGEFDGPTRSWIASNESLAQSVIEQVRASTNYSSAVIAAKEAFQKAQNPVVALSKKINELSLALEIAGESSDRAFNTLYKIGEIEIKSRSEAMQAAGTVTPENLIKGTSAAKIQNDLLKAAQETKTELRSFASNLIKESKESGTVLKGSLKTLIEGIRGGNVSSEAALKALIQVQKTGSPDQKKIATETLQKIRSINATQITNQKIEEANARAQLNALKNQQIATLRNTQFSEQQANALRNFDKNFNDDGIAKSSLQKITEMNNAIATLVSIGADQEILAELTEINAQTSELENLRASFSAITGRDIEGGSLEELKVEISKFIQKGGVGDLSADRAKFFTSLQKTLRDALARQAEGGVKTEDQVKASQLIEIDANSIDSLSSKMAKVIGEGISSALNIGPDIAKAVNEGFNIDILSQDIKDLSAKNAQNNEKNINHQEKLNTALIQALKDSNFSGSADSLSRAASALENAVDKITIIPNGAASGFVPSFSSSGEAVSRAIKTERALGGKPVVDYNKQVGTYVRDGSTQPNFSAVKRDHPEGIKKATSNSKTIQGYSRAGGFVPNFISNISEAPSIDGSFDLDEKMKRAYSYGEPDLISKGALDRVYGKFSPRSFQESFMIKAMPEQNLENWKNIHPKFIKEIINKNNELLSDLTKGDKRFGNENIRRKNFESILGSGFFAHASKNGNRHVDSEKKAYDALIPRQVKTFNLLEASKSAMDQGFLSSPILSMGAKLDLNAVIGGGQYSKLGLVAATDNLNNSTLEDILGVDKVFDVEFLKGKNYIPQLKGGSELLKNSFLQDRIFSEFNQSGRFKLPLTLESGTRSSGLTGLKYNNAQSVWSNSGLKNTNSIVEEIISENNKIIGTQLAYKDLEANLTKETLEEQGTNFNPLLLKDAQEENLYYTTLQNKINDYIRWYSENKSKGFPSYVSAEGKITPMEGGDSKLSPYSKYIDDSEIIGHTPVDRGQNFVDQSLSGVLSNKIREVNSRFVEGFFPRNFEEAAMNILPEGGDVTNAFDKAVDVLKKRKSGLAEAIKEKEAKGEDVTVLQAQVKQLKEKEIQLEDAKEAAAEKLVGAEAATKKVKEEAAKKEQTDLQKERNLLYLGLLGKEAQETRGGLPAFQVQERIDKVKNVLEKYPPYIDNLIRPRKRRAAEAARLSEKFDGSGDPRAEKYKKIQNKNESIINMLEERKRIYQSPEGLAHFYYQDASKLSKVEGERVGASIWDTDPNYLQLFSDLKKRYAIGEVGAEKQLTDKGVESRDILEKYPQYRNNELANIFAQIQEQEGNRPSAFSQKFKASKPEERIQLMQSIGARSGDPEEIKGFFKNGGPIEMIKKINALSNQSLEPEMSFLLTEMLASKGNQVAKEAVLGKIKSMGLPFMATEPAGGFLQSQKIDIFGAGGVKSKVNAVDPSSISDLINFMTDTQIEGYIEANKAKLEQEGIADSPKLIDLITGKKQSLLDFPVYLNHRANMNPDFLEQLVKSKLKNTASVNNLASWDQKYTNKVYINRLSEKKMIDGYDGFYGNYIPSQFAKQPDPNFPENKPMFLLEEGQEVNPFEQFGNRRTSPAAAAKKVIESFNHGTNKDFEDILSNDKHPFPELGVPVGDRLEQFKSRAYAIAKQVKNLTYAPAGYGKEYQKDSPAGEPSMIADLISTYENIKVANKAGGFIPNFSAVAGEIAASRMAGYKSPVSPSQVKTMNIPGQGKTAYNTQESVFKLPGMSQPFIAPPSSSKAAKPYKKEVQKKFNFNPYGKTSADGFIPNFAGGLDSAAFEKSMKSFSSSVSGFERYVSSFDKAVSSLDFKEFAASSKQIFNSAKEFSNQSNTIKQAAALFNEGSNRISQSQPTASIDLSPMTSAASTITAGLNQLSDELGKPIQIDSSAITASMSQLTNALGNVKGSVDLNIPQVNVAVNGASAISSSIASTIKSQIPGIVAESINSQKQAIIDEVKRSIFG